MTELGDTPADIDLHSTLGTRLYRARYTEPGLRQLWGAAVGAALVRNNAAPAIHGCQQLIARSGDDPTVDGSVDEDLAALALLFHFHRQVPFAAIRRALGEEACAAAVAAGLLEISGAAASAPFAITPYEVPVGVPRGFRTGDENLYLISDHGTLVEPGVLESDFVLGLGGAGRTLVSLTPRDHVSRAADIGTGCGIQALLLARHCDRVIATDVSARALRLAALGARLNGVENIEFRSGSLLEPLTEAVDLLVSNPPFVITPRSAKPGAGSPEPGDSSPDPGVSSPLPAFEYRDAGMTGDRLVRSLFTSIPEVLAPGGRSVCLGNWEITEEDSSGPEAWITAPEVSVLVIEREALDPVAYAETWIRDGGVQRAGEQWNRATAAWSEDFASRGVTEIVFGYLVMEKPDFEAEATDNDFGTFESTGDPALAASGGPTRSPALKDRVRITSAPAAAVPGIGEFVQTILGLRSWLQGVDAEEFATTAFTRSPDLVEHRHFVPGDPDPTSITLEQGIGFGQVFDLDTALAGFVSVADGTLTLRQTAAALAQLLEVNPTALEDQLIAQVRQLVAAGALLPAEGAAGGSD